MKRVSKVNVKSRFMLLQKKLLKSLVLNVFLQISPHKNYHRRSFTLKGRHINMSLYLQYYNKLYSKNKLKNKKDKT